MRLLIQRVTQAEVKVKGKPIGSIGSGMLIFLGVGREDSAKIAQKMAQRVAKLRIFADETGKMNLDIKQSGGEVLVVSQFTLYGNCRKGNRPSFAKAAKPEEAEALYQLFAKALKDEGLRVETGKFGAYMEVSLANNGPVTIWMEDESCLREFPVLALNRFE